MNAYQVPADPTAVMGRRVVAYLIDFVLFVVLTFFIPFIVFLRIADHRTFPPGTADAVCETVRNTAKSPVLCFKSGDDVWATEGRDSTVVLLIGVAGAVLSFSNRVFLEGGTGASVGKHLLGIRVVKRTDGTVCGIGKAFIRSLAGLADVAFSAGLVGLIVALTTKGHRRIGDMAASTLVVDKVAVGRPPIVPGLTAPPGYAPAPYAPTGASPPAWGQPAGGWGAPPPPSPWGQPPQPSATPTWPPPAPTPARAPAPVAPVPPAEPAPIFEPEPIFGADAAPVEPPRVQPAPLEPAPARAPAPAPAPQVQPAPVTTAETTAAQPGVGAPMWDVARNAYIQWDPALSKWMQWDDQAKAWRPLG